MRHGTISAMISPFIVIGFGFFPEPGMSPATQWVGAIVGIRTDSRIYPFRLFRYQRILRQEKHRHAGFAVGQSRGIAEQIVAWRRGIHSWPDIDHPSDGSDFDKFR